MNVLVNAAMPLIEHIDWMVRINHSRSRYVCAHYEADSSSCRLFFDTGTFWRLQNEEDAVDMVARKPGFESLSWRLHALKHRSRNASGQETSKAFSALSVMYSPPHLASVLKPVG